jgi:hypothetical protein
VRRLGRVCGLLGPMVGAFLAGLACCAPGLAGFLAPVVFAVVGVGGLYFLAAFEVPLAFLAAGAALLACRQAPGRLAKLGSGLLAAVALLTGLTRLLWDLDSELVMALPPVYLFFVERQTLLAPVALFALVTGLAGPLPTAAAAVRQALRRRGLTSGASPRKEALR